MTALTDEWPHALDSVRLILAAERRASTWTPSLQAQARLALPTEWFNTFPWEAWLTTVALFASPDEHPVLAAQRLTKYLLTYQETYGRMPTLATVQRHAADRHLKEPRP